MVSIIIPNRVTFIGAGMFYGCKNLTSIEIPSSVVSIGENAFTFCTGLHDIYCYAEHVPEIDNAAFVSVNLENATLHVPASTLMPIRRLLLGATSAIS